MSLTQSSLFSPFFVSTGAVIEPPYRYLLWRMWDASRTHITFVMLNPSTANAYEDDPTLRRCLGFARAWGYGALLVVNVFAYQSPSAQILRTVADPVGPDNDRYLLEVAAQSEDIIVAWGTLGSLHQRDRVVSELLASQGKALFCLGITKEGHPRHPLYLASTTIPQPFAVRHIAQDSLPDRQHTKGGAL